MSNTIKAAIQALKGRIADAYTAISNKGGTLPVTQDSANLPTAIASIPSGISNDGFYPVEGATMAQMFQGKMIDHIDNASISTLWQYFNVNHSPYIKSVRMTALMRYDGSNTCFAYCSNLKDVDLPIVSSICAYMFDSSGVENVNAPNVTTLGYACFYGCKMKEVNFPLVNGNIPRQVFNNCFSLKKANLPLIKGFGGSALNNTYSLIDLICGANFTTNVNFYTWAPAYGLDSSRSDLVTDSEDEFGNQITNNLQQFMYNLRRHMAANLPDITGQSSLVLTFAAALKSAILADQPTADAFTNKGWTIA